MSQGSDSGKADSKLVSDSYLYEPSCRQQKDNTFQNRNSYYHLAQCCDQYIISVWAAVVTSVLIDYGVLGISDMTSVADRSKLKRKKN